MIIITDNSSAVEKDQNRKQKLKAPQLLELNSVQFSSDCFLTTFSFLQNDEQMYYFINAKKDFFFFFTSLIKYISEATLSNVYLSK